MRYAWDLHHVYLREAGLERGIKGALARGLLRWARIWDLRTANGVDHFIANSNFVARRIRKIYKRSADVIYPPVEIENFRAHANKEDFYLAIGRMVPYKCVSLIIKAFANLPEKRLVVIGDGPEFKKIKRIATPNIELLGYQPTSAVRDYMARARACIFAALEDFGIATVEAQASGTPVIAYGRGGSREIVRPPGAGHPTGVFFENQTPEAIMAAVDKFEWNRDSFAPEACRRNAERFSAERFRAQLSAYVEDAWDALRDELPRSEGDRTSDVDPRRGPAWGYVKWFVNAYRPPGRFKRLEAFRLRTFDWREKTTLPEGMRRTYQWHLENNASARPV